MMLDGTGISAGMSAHEAAVLRQEQVAQEKDFWRRIMEEMTSIDPSKEQFKNQELPLSRIKRVMKLENDMLVETSRNMISAEAPLVLAKACEMFILELTLRGWSFAEDVRRRTLLKSDVVRAVWQSEVYDFLIDTIPREEVPPPSPLPQQMYDGRYHTADRNQGVYSYQPGPAGGPYTLPPGNDYHPSHLSAPSSHPASATPVSSAQSHPSMRPLTTSVPPQHMHSNAGVTGGPSIAPTPTYMPHAQHRMHVPPHHHPVMQQPQPHMQPHPHPQQIPHPHQQHHTQPQVHSQQQPHTQSHQQSQPGQKRGASQALDMESSNAQSAAPGKKARGGRA